MSRKAGLGWMQCLLKSTPGIGTNNPDDHPDPSEDPGGREREQGDRHLGVQLSAHNWAPLHQHGWQQNFNNMVVNGELLSELFNSFERI